jgi:hypothetical protein
MRRVSRPAHRWRAWQRRHWAFARAAGFGCAQGAALAASALSPAWTQELDPTTSGEQGAVTDWASDVATDVARGRGEPVEASRVSLDVRGGAVVVQWSLSYVVHVSIRGSPANPRPVALVEAVAALERNGVEIARWILGDDRTQGRRDSNVQAWVTGTASGLFVDRAPGFGRTTYVLKVWNERAKRHGTVTVSTRAMICEKR